MDWYPFVLIGVGLVGLLGGGELLVRGASAIATSLKIPPLVIGLTVVAFGTSAPEMAVSVQSSLAGQTDLAVGNVIGSNICNVLLILGISALITPLVVSQQLVRREVPLCIIVSIIVYIMGYNGTLSRTEGIALFIGLIVYLVWSLVQAKKGMNEEKKALPKEMTEADLEEVKKGWGYLSLQIVFVLIGLLLLTVGSDWLVDGSVEVARQLGVSELIIGLTIIAGGTSMPEVAASVMASLRGHRDLAVGNVMGSNLFNLLGVLGLAGIFAQDGVIVSKQMLMFDLPVLIAVSIACLPIFFTEHIIRRWEGALFLGYYIAYMVYIVLSAIESPFYTTFSNVMIYFVIPLTAITLITGVVRAIRSGEKNGNPAL
ncbi:Inner membrane protein YrbG [Planctomycetales bacterium 10988]|nr:Inner membrane protein YrbG [Planctomycetales bacterium 10988]